MKTFNIRSIASLCLLTGLIISSGCKKQLDINHDPNFPTYSQGTPAVVFPAGVLAVTGKVGGDLAIFGGMWSQIFTQAALAQQYTDIDAYNTPPTDGNVNNPYDVMFSSGLKNFQFVIDQADSEGDWNYYLLGTVMKAYTAEVLVDLYDQMPYSQALQGLGNLNPKFDDGYSIYTSLISSIDNALSKDFTVNTNTLPGGQDLIFGGNMNQWVAFANTLKLKMYLRMVNAHPDVATAGIAALMSGGATFLETDASVTNFTDNPGLDNPLYEQNIRQLNTATNLRASTTFVSWLEANSDPRAISFFGSATPGSINQGDFRSISPAYSAAAIFVESPKDPVVFISGAESYFMQAEAAVRYSGGAGAQVLYNLGVTAAFTSLGLDASSFIAPGGAYEFPTGGTQAQQIQAIVTQEWASCAYGCHQIEGWFQKNRTGYPLTSPVYSTDPSYIPGQLVVSKTSVLTPANEMPKRLPYPYDETSRNTNAPKTIVPITTPVWWGM